MLLYFHQPLDARRLQVLLERRPSTVIQMMGFIEEYRSDSR
jgi:hypothetical protein